jgi:2-hydroxy-6-oxonona-2,4-dienedioate hydrolase
MALDAEGLMRVPGVFSRYARLASGSMAHYFTAGESGRSVVLLHGGIAGSSGMAGWRMMMPFLAQNGYRVYAPDRPGFGLCDIRPGYMMEKGVRDQVRFIREFVEAVGLEEPFFLGGNSQGAQMGASYAVEYPETVERMVLIASPSFHARMGLGNGMGRGTMRRQGPFDGTTTWMRNQMEALILNQAAITDDLMEMRTRMGVRDEGIAAAYQAWAREEMADPGRFQSINLLGRMDKLAIPTIFLWGKQDVIAPVEMGYELEAVLPNMQFFFPDNCGHQGQTDQPEMFDQAFLEFFRDGRVSRKTADWAGISKNRPELTEVVEQVPSAAPVA